MEQRGRGRLGVLFSRGGKEIMDATFRGAEPADTRALYELSVPFVGTGDLIFRDLDLFSTQIKDFYVVEVNGAVAACAGVRPLTGSAEIFNVVVGARWQRLGLGRFLLACVLIELHRLGFPTAIVFSKTASAWFARYGFSRIDPAMLPASRLAVMDPERDSIPMSRGTLRAEDGIEAQRQLTDVMVEFDRSGVTHRWDGSMDSLLPFVTAKGIEVDSLCWGGVCGTCSTRLRRGTVNYLLEPEAYPYDGRVLLCISRPMTDLVLDL